MTNPEIRREILLQLYATRPLARTAGQMHRTLMRSGETTVTAQDLAREAEFLVGQSLAERRTAVTTGEPIYTITSAGVITIENER